MMQLRPWAIIRGADKARRLGLRKAMHIGNNKSQRYVCQRDVVEVGYKAEIFHYKKNPQIFVIFIFFVPI